MTTLVFKKKDWTSPEGELIKGKTIIGELFSFNEKQIAHAKKEGFHHLVDGTFAAYKKKGYSYNIFLGDVEEITLEDGTPVRLEYTGHGNTFYVAVGK